MKRRWIRKVLKIIAILVLLLLVVAAWFLYDFTTPKSDERVLEILRGETGTPTIRKVDFKGHEVRVIQMQEELDTLLPILFLVHGSPGSTVDFKRYLLDEDILSRANVVSYDRVGYGRESTGKVLPSLAEELELLHRILEPFPTGQVVLAGYSYGGTLVMASDRNFRKKIVLAPAVRGDLEPMFLAMKFYQWSWTRNFIPNVFQGAAEEKLRHVQELPAYADAWTKSPSPVLAIHGNKDHIVPYENSLYLQGIFPAKQFRLVTLEGGNHALIWNEYQRIKEQILLCLEP